jgi:hypothetical protein
MTTTPARTIAVIGSRDMGAPPARTGLRVVTDAPGRSADSRGLATAAGIEELRSRAAPGA